MGSIDEKVIEITEYMKEMSYLDAAKKANVEWSAKTFGRYADNMLKRTEGWKALADTKSLVAKAKSTALEVRPSTSIVKAYARWLARGIADTARQCTNAISPYARRFLDFLKGAPAKIALLLKSGWVLLKGAAVKAVVLLTKAVTAIVALLGPIGAIIAAIALVTASILGYQYYLSSSSQQPKLPGDTSASSSNGDGASTLGRDDRNNTWVAWYTENIGYRPIYVSTKFIYELDEPSCSYAGGGTDCSVILKKTFMHGPFSTKKEAAKKTCDSLTNFGRMKGVYAGMLVAKYGGNIHNIENIGCGLEYWE